MLGVNQLIGFGAGAAGTPVGGGGGDPFWDNVILLAGFDGADGATSFTDESPAAHGAFTFVADAQLDTSEKKFGLSSLLLDGTGDYVSLPDHDDWTIPASTKFTIEAQVFVATGVTGFNTFVSHIGPTGNRAWKLMSNLNAAQVFFQMYNPSNGLEVSIVSPNDAFTHDQWVHLAVVRDAANLWKLYIDGLAIADTHTSSSASDNCTLTLQIGAEAGGSLLNGWIDEVRITAGIARYTENFTPPTAKFPRS